jgi:hypothetical protein
MAKSYKSLAESQVQGRPNEKTKTRHLPEIGPALCQGENHGEPAELQNLTDDRLKKLENKRRRQEHSFQRLCNCTNHRSRNVWEKAWPSL